MPRVVPATRRQLTLLIAVAGIAAAVVAAVLIPVPYVILSPGPTLNTLGAKPSGKDLIQISGHHTYPTNGHLNLVTVAYQGGPADSLNLFAALQGWLTPHEAVVPQAELFGTEIRIVIVGTVVGAVVAISLVRLGVVAADGHESRPGVVGAHLEAGGEAMRQANLECLVVGSSV